VIHKWTIAKTPKKNSHKETIAINLIHRITHLMSQHPIVVTARLVNVRATKKTC